MSAAIVLASAIALLGRSPGSLPSIILIDKPPWPVSARAEGFVHRNPDRIYLITSTDAFAGAQRGSSQALRKIASIIVHEEWHLMHGPDEEGAYLAQLRALASLGLGPDSRVADTVRLSMVAAVDAQRRAARRPARPAARR
ncbi:MAG TPA: hypothetical protein VNI78_06020 [Vicinamibacterales bacterium]|nr:hypothetical protein [Vicinamibacterales bacterium]